MCVCLCVLRGERVPTTPPMKPYKLTDSWSPSIMSYNYGNQLLWKPGTEYFQNYTQVAATHILYPTGKPNISSGHHDTWYGYKKLSHTWLNYGGGGEGERLENLQFQPAPDYVECNICVSCLFTLVQPSGNHKNMCLSESLRCPVPGCYGNQTFRLVPAHSHSRDCMCLSEHK